MTFRSVLKVGIVVVVLAAASCAHAATTINSVNRHAYGANIGWLNWQGDISSGAVIGEFVCSGYVYTANAGWIHLGSGSPANGVRYLNNSATDFGVNHDGVGDLTGFAWGANIGWLNFTNRDATGAVFAGPRVDLASGRLTGFIWSANCGWISLSNSVAFVQTDSMPSGPDIDGDGLPDAWERSHTMPPSLTFLDRNGDPDGDGFSNIDEYFADTDPDDPSSLLRITAYSAAAEGTSNTITWTSRPTRTYLIMERDSLDVGSTLHDVGLGNIPPGAHPSITRTFGDALSSHRFFVIEAFRPLAP